MNPRHYVTEADWSSIFELGYRLGYEAGHDVGHARAEEAMAEDWHDLYLHVKRELKQPTVTELSHRRTPGLSWGPGLVHRRVTSAELDALLAKPDPVACGGRSECTELVTPPTIVCDSCVDKLIWGAA